MRDPDVGGGRGMGGEGEAAGERKRESVVVARRKAGVPSIGPKGLKRPRLGPRSQRKEQDPRRPYACHFDSLTQARAARRVGVAFQAKLRITRSLFKVCGVLV